MGSNPIFGCVGTDEKYSQLQSILRTLGKAAICFSGGVDSTFLLKAAVDTLGAGNVRAYTCVSPSLPGGQRQQARELAAAIGAACEEIDLHELDDPHYSVNRADRCFHCKSHQIRAILDAAHKAGFEHILNGANHDDRDDYRPGNRAAAAFGVRSPLAEAGFAKDDIRAMSRALGLETADMPASPCLASRISYGLEITAERLGQVEEAEAFLQSLGFGNLRVRHHDTVARIEVPGADIGRIAEKGTRELIVEKLKAIGFRFVTLDLEGFQSGSLNRLLSEQEKQQHG